MIQRYWRSTIPPDPPVRGGNGHEDPRLGCERHGRDRPREPTSRGGPRRGPSRAGLRAHGLPFTCGLYPKKGPRQFAAEFRPGTTAVRFGTGGGLTDIRYCGFGFAHVRRVVFDAVRMRFRLPTCNQRFGTQLVPYFEPMSVPDPGGRWSLSEDYAFCERAGQAGFRPAADTRVRLWHVGSYRYGWEDAGSAKDRYADYTFHLPGAPPGGSG